MKAVYKSVIVVDLCVRGLFSAHTETSCQNTRPFHVCGTNCTCHSANTKSGGMIFIQPAPLWHTCVFSYFCWRPVITDGENKIPLLGMYSRERQKRMKESEFQQRLFQHCFKPCKHYFHCQNDGFCFNIHLTFKIILKRSRWHL